MDTPQDIVFQSYGRCCIRDQFFSDFYDCFMGKSDEIRQMFVDTDMPSQRHLLRNGIMQLILFSRGLPDSKLKALGESHSRHGYDIKPHLYNIWLEALLETLRQHDKQYSPQVESAWRHALTPGIDLIKSAY
ncbi:globin [Gilvimarinus xylanilyticus]|uniref:Globin n=1 Tax=Gilvimarinus xylanilyticus TaxID=2944139 RepID=A0A9X2HX29_9GAMM|nr:globin [Gilvimarinus xylanilyticus]MCP8898171.1 globin [Gilvimarinus xylanilyticus]